MSEFRLPLQVSKKIKYDEPDVIVEFDEYVIFIECKSKPFNLLDSLHNFDDCEFSKIDEEFIKSNENIDRYLAYKNTFKDKQLYRVMVYLFLDSVMLSSVVPRPISSDMLIVTDIKSLEMLFSLEDVDYGKVLEEYCGLVRDQKVSSLETHLETYYSKMFNDKVSKNNFSKVFRKYLKD